MSGSTMRAACLASSGVVAAVFQDLGPWAQVVGHVVGWLPGVVEVLLAVGVDERVDGRVPAAVHLRKRPVPAQADRGPDPDLRVGAEYVVGHLQCDRQGASVEIPAGDDRRGQLDGGLTVGFESMISTVLPGSSVDLNAYTSVRSSRVSSLGT